MVKDERLHSLECLFEDEESFYQAIQEMSVIKRQELCQSLKQLFQEFSALSQSSHNYKELVACILRTSDSLNPAKIFCQLEDQAGLLIGCQRVGFRVKRSKCGF